MTRNEGLRRKKEEEGETEVGEESFIMTLHLHLRRPEESIILTWKEEKLNNTQRFALLFQRRQGEDFHFVRINEVSGEHSEEIMMWLSRVLMLMMKSWAESLWGNWGHKSCIQDWLTQVTDNNKKQSRGMISVSEVSLCEVSLCVVSHRKDVLGIEAKKCIQRSTSFSLNVMSSSKKRSKPVPLKTKFLSLYPANLSSSLPEKHCFLTRLLKQVQTLNHLLSNNAVLLLA